MAWTHISMDFIEGLPKSRGKEVILVVVDRLTKYAHFLSLAHPYSVQHVVQVFMDNILKLHGMPITIVTDRDRIFTSHLFQEIFKMLKVTLRLSTAYHPQTDRQTERVNQCLEAYLRSMTFQEPREWMNWLTLAEWWYNTTYHTSLKVTPFQALYGYPPPQVGELSIPCNVSEEARITVEQKEQMLEQLKSNLHNAQDRMKHYADKSRTERQFQVGDMVYLKMQPYRLTAFGLRGSLKLRSKFYGPFRVLEKLGTVAYRLQLPEHTLIHPVFHVNQLKKHLGSHAVPLTGLPLVGENGKIKTEPVVVLDRRIVPRRNEPVAQLLIQWLNLGPEDAT
uniref:Putative retrotransposon protein n=1 Tax=Phyllostachys edulis TaxID=38705 RepID=D3IVG4_PHYED|nr:putative retrotransposon protein [Phyllostachys edulis]